MKWYLINLPCPKRLSGFWKWIFRKVCCLRSCKPFEISDKLFFDEAITLLISSLKQINRTCYLSTVDRTVGRTKTLRIFISRFLAINLFFICFWYFRSFPEKSFISKTFEDSLARMITIRCEVFKEFSDDSI